MNQSDTNPLATALAALMTGHNANPNTSLRIPLVDSNGNLQPGPTLAELAAVLGGLFAVVSSDSDFSDYTRYGIYRVPNSTVASSIIDIPEKVGGTLVVTPAINANYVRQEYQTRYNIYVRNCAVASGVESHNWVKYTGTEI